MMEARRKGTHAPVWPAPWRSEGLDVQRTVSKDERTVSKDELEMRMPGCFDYVSHNPPPPFGSRRSQVQALESPVVSNNNNNKIKPPTANPPSLCYGGEPAFVCPARRAQTTTPPGTATSPPRIPQERGTGKAPRLKAETKPVPGQSRPPRATRLKVLDGISPLPRWRSEEKTTPGEQAPSACILNHHRHHHNKDLHPTCFPSNPAHW